MVGLKDFDMPSCCNSCEHWSFNRDDEPLCDLTYDYISQFDKRLDTCPLVKAIPIEVLEQIREEIEKRMETIIGRYDNSIPEHDRPLCICARNEARQECIEIIDKAIKEYMDGNK